MKKMMYLLAALTLLIINADIFGQQWSGPTNNTVWNNSYTGVGYSLIPDYRAQFMVNGSLSLTNGDVTDGYTFIRDLTKLQLKFNDWEIAGNTKTYMTFLKTGNIGVGIDNPSYKFHVNGTFNASTIYQNGTQIVSSQWTTASGNIYFNTGNVGIGTSTINDKLHVAGNIQSSATDVNHSFALVNTTNNKAWRMMQLNSTDGYSPNGLLFEHQTAPGSYSRYMTISQTGNVGIGSTNPSFTKLEVIGGISNGGSDFYLGRNDGRNQGTLLTNRAMVHSDWGIGNDNLVINFEGDFEGGVHIQGPKTILDGNLGIGVTNPLTRLDLGTSGKVRAQSLELGEGWSRIDWNLYWDNGSWKYRNNGWGANLQMNDDNGSIQFVTYASGTAGAVPTGQNYAMTIKPNGYIGIGTTNPQSLLAVNGKITAKEVEVTLTGWSDFVFADNYKLMPLHELEKSIKSNKHLPGIPSEKEVLANGVSLGEMQAKLLQKVEELTLYVIDLKKENDQLKKQMDQLNR